MKKQAYHAMIVFAMQTSFSVYSTNYYRRTVVGITLNAIPLDVG